jgi:hypothetical protein
MTVAEFIEFLKTQPQDILVAYKMHSEQCLLEPDDMYVGKLTHARPDGWIQNARWDMPLKDYLILPGN